MKYKTLGRSGLYVSEICLGTMTYGGKGFWEVIGKLGVDAVAGQLRTALDAGVNFLDTANVYHEGESEKLVAAGMKQLGLRRDEFVIATKVHGRTGKGANDVGLSRRHIMSAIDASLARLETDHVDLYQIHGYDPATPPEEVVAALSDVVRAGKARYVGFCNLPAWVAMKMLAIAERTGAARFISAQMFYAIAARDIEREIVPLAKSEGLGIMPWSPLAGGLLSGKFTAEGAQAGGIGGPAESRRAQFDFPVVDKPRAFRCVDAMRPIAAAHGVSVARVALAYILAKPGVTSVIVGARTAEQLADNLAAADLALTADELGTLDDVSALPPEYPGWMTGFQIRDRYVEGAVRP
jgi:aryl-alcohol dehydrogenase-like predicted oxidoreductase